MTGKSLSGPWPALSVVVPTRDRSVLCLEAVRSTCWLTLPEVEVVVSDNSTLAEESQRLREGIQALGDARVRLVAPSVPLSMSEHWEFAVGQARGQFITVLTDRMVFNPILLERALQWVLSSTHIDVLSYANDNVFDAEGGYSVIARQRSDRVLIRDSVAAQRNASRCTFTVDLPRALNCLFSARLLGDLRQTFGGAFRKSHSPDFAFAFRLLASRPRYAFFDAPVLVARGSSVSNGGAFRTGKLNAATADFIASSKALEHSPFPHVLLSPNGMVEEYLHVRASLSGSTQAAVPPAIDEAKLRGMLVDSWGKLKPGPWREEMGLRLREAGCSLELPERGEAEGLSALRRLWIASGLRGPRNRLISFAFERFGLHVLGGPRHVFLSEEEAMQYLIHFPRRSSRGAHLHTEF